MYRFEIRKKNILILAVCILFNTGISCRAEGSTTIDLNDSNQYTMTSDGQNGNKTNTTSDTNTNTNSNTTKHYTKEEKNALNSQNTIRSDLSDWINRIKNTDNYRNGKFFGKGDGDSVVNFSYITVKKNDIAKILNNVNSYKGQFDNRNASNSSGNGWVNQTSVPETTLNHNSQNSDYSQMSDEEKNEVKTGIIKNERGETNLSKDTLSKDVDKTLRNNNSSLGNSKFTVSGSGTNPKLNINWKNNNKNNINNKNNKNLTNNHNYQNDMSQSMTIRPDIYGGSPLLNIPSNSYSDRFKPYEKESITEHWPYNNRDGKNYRIYNTDPSKYKSAVLNDNVYIALLTEYHIESTQKNYITNINYTSDERRWSVYLDGEQVGEPVITDNPRHELNFTEIYEEHGPGEYYVEAEQLAKFTRSTYASYDVCEYLYDMKTGTILWFNEKLVSANNGKGVYLGSERINEPEWVSTGDTFTVTVNDVGGIETNDNDSTNRTD